MSNCINCGNKIEQTVGKREKQYCDSTCRSNYFQKRKRLEKVSSQEPPNNRKNTKSTKMIVNEPAKVSETILAKFNAIKEQLKNKQNGK